MHKILLLTVSLFLISGCNDNPTQQKKALAIHVDTLTLQYKNTRLSSELPGRISAIKEAEVRPQVSGIITERLFKEGKEVKQGDVLYQIDPATYQANVNSAEATLNRTLADQNVAKKTLNRVAELAKKKLSSQQDFDDAQAAYEQATAEVAVSQAALDYSNILLSYTQVTAPISGRIGISQVSEGALVTAEQSNYLTTIQQINDVYVDMSQSSLSLLKLKREFPRNKDHEQEPTIPVDIKMEDGTGYPVQGYLEASDISVDESTGSMTLRAIVSNPNNELLPGIFVRATIYSPSEKDYIVIPQSIVVRSQTGEPFVYIANDKNIVEKRAISLGNEMENNWIVLDGLKEGEQVIINNLQKIKEGASVVIDNAIPPLDSSSDSQSVASE
ncbi:efflux RND transporter periplasmic adaptor subunit [Aliivibrio fischeri]|uniref:efflux RND transporter periplasmic adaptor subunit n=1 Tax=Aliivibrio fischeri TaxID=668 RepID=UPI0012DA6043|nr:efflux RND transporter periplasmic adaptor subunit [Aliivibrio fischeri]MUJ36945.1 efflux RND transporter periplasmic adaptor subunit [Aliivibrio fischeri]